MKKEKFAQKPKLTLEKKTIATLSNNQMKYINGAINNDLILLSISQDINQDDGGGCTGRPPTK
jgi:hypothetical protein